MTKTLLLSFLFLIPLPAFANTLTVYPNAAGSISTSNDGNVYFDTNNQSWTTVHNAASGGGINQSPTNNIFVTFFQTGSSNNTWLNLARSYFLFDTSALTSSATISGATFSLYGTSKEDLLTITPDINVYSATPSSNTSLALGDYSQVGTTAFSTTITYAGWSTSGYNDFVLNSNGISNISLTGVSKFSARNAQYDVANSAPPYNDTRVTSDVDADFASNSTGDTHKPKLVITYSLPSSAPPPPTTFFSFQ